MPEAYEKLRYEKAKAYEEPCYNSFANTKTQGNNPGFLRKYTPSF